jgi:iron complex outermembrane receptor protein
MNFKRLFMMLALPLVTLSLPALAQDKVVTGKVTDLKDGKAIVGASVLVKGTNIGTQTKADGSFSLSAPSNATTIVVSYVGYTTQELLIGSGSMSVSLVQSSSTLNDVVVVAYGTRKKGDLTGSVTSVTAKDFQKGVNNSSEQLLQGKVAGLQVTNGGGYAGGGSKLRIRGGASLNASNDPLIVIDGVPVESNGLGNKNQILQNILSTINRMI